MPNRPSDEAGDAAKARPPCTTKKDWGLIIANDKRLKIRTDYVYPPIPIRDFDWSAVFDGYEPGDLQGSGPTEEAACQDLIEQYEERE